MSKKPITVIMVTLAAIGVVGGLSLLMSGFIPVITTDTSFDSSSDSSSTSEEPVFDISEVAQYSLIEQPVNHFLSKDGDQQVSFELDGDWYIDTYSGNPEFEMNYGFNTPTTDFINNYGSYYMAYFNDGYGIGCSFTATSYSKFSLEFTNHSSSGGNTYRVGLDISSTGADIDFMLSDELGHFENEFTFYHHEITYFEIPPGETYRIDHLATTSAIYIDAIYIYYFIGE